MLAACENGKMCEEAGKAVIGGFVASIIDWYIRFQEDVGRIEDGNPWLLA